MIYEIFCKQDRQMNPKMSVFDKKQVLSQPFRYVVPIFLKNNLHYTVTLKRFYNFLFPHFVDGFFCWQMAVSILEPWRWMLAPQPCRGALCLLLHTCFNNMSLICCCQTCWGWRGCRWWWCVGSLSGLNFYFSFIS